MNKNPKKRSLFDSEDNGELSLNVNKKFAKAYNEDNAKKEFIQCMTDH